MCALPLLLLAALSLSLSTAAAPYRRDAGDAAGRTLSELREAELERYAILMLDPAVGDSFPAGTAARRITAKSVFIAPSIIGNQCAEGYQQDDMGRCVKVVKGDAKKSWDLLLDRLNNQYASDIDPVPEASEPPGPPPGPLQVAIPIAEGPDTSSPSLDAFVAVPSSTTQQTVAPLEVTELTTFSAGEETTTAVTELDINEDQTNTSQVLVSVVSQEDDGLVPEVVMVSSEEQLQPVASHISSFTAGIDDITPAAVVLPPSEAGNTSRSDVYNSNPNVNTVNRSPLVTGTIADASNPLIATVTAVEGLMNVPATTQSPAAIEQDTLSSHASSSVTEISTEEVLGSAVSRGDDITVGEGSSTSSPTTPGSVYSSSTESPRSSALPPKPFIPISFPPSTQDGKLSTLEDITSSSSTTSETILENSSSSSVQSSSSSGEGPYDNQLRPAPPLASRIPAIAPDVVRFPTEKPTLFRTATGVVRFPTIDVTFPTGAAAPRPDANWLREKPVKFPKDDPLNLWRLPPPPSPASNWSLEQTRNKPYLFRYWSRSPSRLSPSSFGDSLSLSSGSSSGSFSSRDSQENGSSQPSPSIWPPAPSPHIHLPARDQHTGNSFEFRRSSSSYGVHSQPPLLTQSHRRGRDRDW